MHDLETEGWTLRFAACEPRLSEAVEVYEEAGFEVRLEPLPESQAGPACNGDRDREECRACYEGVEEQYRIIFTRPAAGGSPSPPPERREA